MKTRTIFFGVVLFFAGVSANAQIGITRDGKVQNIVGGVSPFRYIFSWEFPRDIIIPSYLPNTKTITIKRCKIKYSEFTEEWEDGEAFFIRIFYDASGKITLIKYYHSYCDYKVSEEKFEKTDDTISLTYKGNKINMISTRNGYYACKYDDNGYMKKIVCGNNAYAQIAWASQGYMSEIKTYDRDGFISGGYYKYIFSLKGRNFEELFYRGKELFRKETYNYDSHGIIVKKSGEYGTGYFDNTYDDNGNTTQQLHYIFREREKKYIDSYRYEYTYDFYEK